MRVQEIHVENVKGCAEATVRPNQAGITIIGGLNGQGKSSFLDGFMMALGGATAIPLEPIKDDEEFATISVKVDGGCDMLPWPATITRTIRRDKKGKGYRTSVEIVSDEGDTAPQPQTILDSFLGSRMIFDPHKFATSTSAEQVQILQRMLGLDFTELDTKRKEIYEERTRINREVKALDGAFKKMPLHSDAPEEEIDVGKLVAEQQEIKVHNEKLTAADRVIEQLTERIANADEALSSMDEEQVQKQDELLKAYQTALDNLNTAYSKKRQGMLHVQAGDKETLQRSQKEREKLGDLKDDAEIIQTLMHAKDINAKVRANAKRLEQFQEKKKKENEASKLTAAITKIDREKQSRAESVKWPIEGLAFGEDGIVFHGIPFSQVASSQALAIGAELAIRQNPDFPFIIVRDGSLLDDEHLCLLADAVEAAGAQGLVERVTTDVSCHIIFEGGMISKVRS